MFCIRNGINFAAYLQGTLIQHLKEHLLHGNMNRQDVIFYYTTVSNLWRFFSLMSQGYPE